MSPTAAAILDSSYAKKFLLAGHAKFTLVSKVSGNRKTFEVRRSWVTKLLWKRCRACRYLIMMYGPSIEVKLVKGASK